MFLVNTKLHGKNILNITMIILLRNMLKQSLKTNDNLYMAVLTGCLRIARESIFTGLNNFNIFSITDQYFDEYFGFTDKEVKEILQSTRSFRTNKEMVWRLSLWKHRYLLPMGCNQSLPSIKSRTRCDTTAILDQYKWKLYRKTLYRESNWRKSNPERNQVRTNIQRTRQHDRESLECTLRNRLPHPTGKTT